jgi:hypothetical protein
MVKYLAIAVTFVASLMIADLAQARGRHGCASCSAGGYGCPGGVCAVPVAPGKSAVTGDAPPALVATPPTSPAPAVAPAQPAPQTYFTSTARRGLFGWRR